MRAAGAADYPEQSEEGRFLRGDVDAVGMVSRWVACVLTDAWFLGLAAERLDLHQEVMASIVESLRQRRFERSRDFRRYVQAIARYTLRRAARGRKHRTEPLGEEMAASGTGAASTHRELLAQEVLASLPTACRQLILAYFFEQLSYEEIAESTSIPVGTVKSRLFRCLSGAHKLLRPVTPRDFGPAKETRNRPLATEPFGRPRAPRNEPCP